jgi:hypothetical protein
MKRFLQLIRVCVCVCVCVCVGSGLECYYRVHDGLHSARQAYCKRLLQNVYLYKYVAGYKLLARFQTRALYEDPSPLYVHCSGLQATTYKTSNNFIFAIFIVLNYICLKFYLFIYLFFSLLNFLELVIFFLHNFWCFFQKKKMLKFWRNVFF